MTNVVAGIDLGGTNTTIGLVDREGKIFAKEHLSTTDYPRPEDFVHAVAEKINILKSVTKSFNPDLKGIGIGAPNGNYFKGTIEHPPNLVWKGITPLAELLKKKTTLQTVVTNDAKAAALGEMFFGGAKEIKDFIVITLGTGLGSGVVINGQLVYGHDGFAGELGHTTVMQHGRQCGCGRRGCLEQYCSATGIVKTYLEILKNSDPEALAHLDTSAIDSKYLYDKGMAGDEDAFYAFNYTGEMLGFALANFVVFSSPAAIFLSGGLANAGELIFNPTILSFEKNLMRIFRDKAKILPSSLPENDAAILGAASLMWNEISLGN